MNQDELFAAVTEKFPGVEKHPAQVKGYLTLKAGKDQLLALVRALKEQLGFNYLEIVTAIDWKGPVDPKGFIVDPNPNHFLPEGGTPQSEPSPPTPGVNYRDSFELVYLLGNLARQVKLFIKVEVPRAGARVPSLTPLYKAADWQERETLDLYGIGFDGHPNPVKILTPDFIAGHPLRKDYVHVKDRYD